MICNACREERDKKDFFVDKKRCYKCVYEEKCEKIKKISLSNCCKMCDQPCADKRWVYCSEDCAAMGKKQHGKDYWIHHVRSMR